jgi:hypothetical protein
MGDYPFYPTDREQLKEAWDQLKDAKETIQTLRAELATARADLARVTGERDEALLLRAAARADLRLTRAERDAAIARAEAADALVEQRAKEVLDAFDDIAMALRERNAERERAEAAERERDHWRSVAESRPAITAEDAAVFASMEVEHPERFGRSNDAIARMRDALRAHAAKEVPR